MPVRDRLNELHAKQELLAKADKSKTMNSKKDHDLNNFLAKASRITGDLATYKTRVDELKKIQLDILNSPFAEQNAVRRYEGLIQEITQCGVRIRTDIRQLEEQAKKGQDDASFNRVAKQQLNGLTSQLALTSNEFFKCQAEYADKMKDRLKRQLYACGESVTDEHVNEILEKESYSVFTQNFITDTEDAAETLRELEERHKDILALEKSVTEVNMLFKDLNLLVTEQGDTLHNIERNVENVEVMVESANDQIKQAKESQSSARKKKFCCFGILGLGVVILIIIIVVVAAQN